MAPVVRKDGLQGLLSIMDNARWHDINLVYGPPLPQPENSFLTNLTEYYSDFFLKSALSAAAWKVGL
jgi:hypothetical protein